MCVYETFEQRDVEASGAGVTAADLGAVSLEIEVEIGIGTRMGGDRDEIRGERLAKKRIRTRGGSWK